VSYPACPKCAHAPLPADQAFPAACPACGLILAKFTAATAAVPAARAPAAGTANGVVSYDAREEAALSEAPERFIDHLRYVPDQVSSMNWWARIAGLVLFGAWTLWIWTDVDIAGGDSGSRFLHLVLTPFHESGHYLIFRWFGQFIMTLGGTLGQHLLPIVLGAALLMKNRNPYGAAIALWLLGYSLIDMGVYMYDAFDPQLMLLDGRTGAESDGHDWQNIFGDLGLLRRARGIGLFWGWVGYATMLAGLVWAAWVVWLQKARLSDSPFAEEDVR
jgi:hypothetical protein